MAKKASGVTNQRLYQLRWAAKGKCYRCKGPLRGYSELCPDCIALKQGSGKWHRGGRGRPPKRYRK